MKIQSKQIGKIMINKKRSRVFENRIEKEVNIYLCN